MPGVNWRESQGQAIGGGAVATDGHNWRTELPPGSRHRIVNKISYILKKFRPVSGEDGLQELEESSVRLEESIFTTATSQSDYLSSISQKLLEIVRKSRNLQVNSLQSSAAGASRNSQDPGMEHNDWRIQLSSESRTRIVNKIVETLKRHLPFSGVDGLLEVERIAVRFEERIYSSATSQSDYLRKISLKMITMGTRYPNTHASSHQFNVTSGAGNPLNPDDALAG